MSARWQLVIMLLNFGLYFFFKYVLFFSSISSVPLCFFLFYSSVLGLKSPYLASLQCLKTTKAPVRLIFSSLKVTRSRQTGTELEWKYRRPLITPEQPCVCCEATVSHFTVIAHFAAKKSFRSAISITLYMCDRPQTALVNKHSAKRVKKNWRR